jgi:hypothetical protein
MEVKLDNGLENLTRQAFAMCTSLGMIQLPCSVKMIGKQAFHGCTQLVDVELHEGLEAIGHHAFFECTSLYRIKIPSTVTSIHWTAFDACSHLLNVEYGDDIEGLISLFSVRDWWDPSNSSKMVYVFARYSVPQRLRMIKAEKWLADIESMLKCIPSIESKHFRKYCRSVGSKLSAYKILTEVSSLLELALWKAAISEHSDYGAEKSECRTMCGASVVIPHVLSFLLGTAADDVAVDYTSDEDDSDEHDTSDDDSDDGENEEDDANDEDDEEIIEDDDDDDE